MPVLQPPINTVVLGDSTEVLKGFPNACLDAVVTDPPYGLGTKEPTGEEIDAFLSGDADIEHGKDFMGKDWQIPSVALWREVYRTLKPAAVLMSFAGTRTLDLMAAGIGAAGFRYLGVCGWLHGQGFPKSLNVSKAIDKAAGVAFESRPASGVGFMGPLGPGGYNVTKNQLSRTGDSTDAAKQWHGWGTSLKPAWEPILVFTKGKSKWKMPPVPFFYCAKAAKSEKSVDGEVENNHVTVKPLKLMQWLVSLAAPTGSLILDPFLGSGTTAAACAEEGRDFVGIERDPHYFEIASKRVGVVKGRADEVRQERDLFNLALGLDDE